MCVSPVLVTLVVAYQHAIFLWYLSENTRHVSRLYYRMMLYKKRIILPREDHDPDT